MKATKGRRLTPEQRIQRAVLRRRRRADANAKRRAEKLGRPAVDVGRDEIIKRDGRNCYLCGKWVSMNELTLDHVLALTEGGTHAPDNIRIAHGVCNSKKGARSLELIDFSSF